MTLKDLPMLLLAWFCLSKPPFTYGEHNPFVHGESYNGVITNKAYEWWWEDTHRANCLYHAASLANLTKQGDVPPWMGFFANSTWDTKEALQEYVWAIKMRWYGCPVIGDR